MSRSEILSLRPDPHDLIVVAGPEAEAFLQGQLSQSVAELVEEEPAWSFLLAPDGKLVALLRIRRSGPDSFEMILDAGFGEAVQTHLARFRLRTDCEITLEAATAGDEIGEADRIEAGVPQLGVDIEPGDLAAATGLVDDAVDFTKGCFIGQELVARMDSRGGSAPRRLVKLRGDQDPPTPGASVLSGETEAGSITSIADTGSGWIAMAKVSRKLAVGSDQADVEGHEVVVEELS